MAEYIEREAATVPSFRYQLSNGEMSPPVVFVKTLLHSIPAADVRPVVRGKWEEVEVVWLADIEEQPDAIASMFCPKCKRFANHVYHYGDPTHGMNFCPNCGADMREANDEKA